MKRIALSTLAMGLIVALGMTACSGDTVDSAAAFSAAMDSADAPAFSASPTSPLTAKATP